MSESHPLAEFIMFSDGTVEEILAQDEFSEKSKSTKTDEPKNAVESVINQVSFRLLLPNF